MEDNYTPQAPQRGPGRPPKEENELYGSDESIENMIGAEQDDEPSEQVRVEPEPPAEPETVEVRKSELDGILSRLNELEQGKKDRTSGLYDGKWQEVEKDDKVMTSTLRVVDGKYAVDWWHLETKFNEKTREKDLIYIIKWLMPDDSYEESEMLLTDFVRTPRQEVKLIHKDTTKLRQVVGKTRRKEVDYANYRTVPKEEVDMVVEMDKTIFNCFWNSRFISFHN